MSNQSCARIQILRPDPTRKKRNPTDSTWPAKICEVLGPDSTRPTGLSIKHKNHKTINKFMILHNSSQYTAVVADYWLTQQAFHNEEAQGLLQCSRSVATACQLYSTSNGRKVFFRLCRTGRDAQKSARSLRHNGIFRHVLLPELQRVAESRWHFQRLRLIVRQINAVSTRNPPHAFLAQLLSFYIDSIWFRHFAETRHRALQLSILTNVYLSCLPCPTQLSRYSTVVRQTG